MRSGSGTAQRNQGRQQQQQQQVPPSGQDQDLSAMDAEEAALLQELGGLDAKLAGVPVEPTGNVETEPEIEAVSAFSPAPPAPLPRGSPAVPKASGTRQPRPPRPPRS
jgi:hypothetical protein